MFFAHKIWISTLLVSFVLLRCPLVNVCLFSKSEGSREGERPSPLSLPAEVQGERVLFFYFEKEIEENKGGKRVCVCVMCFCSFVSDFYVTGV